MKLAVSNIAWAPTERDTAYALLQAHGVRGLEIAPGLLFHGATDPFEPTAAELVDALTPMHDAGLELVSMQSLLFGVDGAALFEGEAPLERFTSGLLRAIRLAGRLRIPNLVFGSPRQRNVPTGMSPAAAEVIAYDVFGRLGDVALDANVRLGIEFNPAAYGTNFLNTVSEAAEFVRHLAHPAVTLILDVGAMHMNGEFDTVEDTARDHADITSHVHLSEPYLAPAPADATQATRVMRSMARRNYQGWYSIEMKRPEEDAVAELDRALYRLVLAASQSSGIASC